MDFREAFYDGVVDGESALAKDLRKMCIDQMHEALPGREDLWEKLTPKYNPGCKRVIISDDYYPSLTLPNVSLETRPIHSISGHAVNVAGDNGELVAAGDDFDLLVCATGFKTVDFMHPISMYGRNGRALGDVWKNGAQAYYGTCIEDMPNFGMLYGPNTNLGHNSIILMIEAQSRYINGLITPVLQARKEGKALSLRPKKDKIDAYNARMQEILLKSSFNDPNCNSWYKNEAGIITNNWSGTVIEYQEQMSKVNFEDYEVEGNAQHTVVKKPVLKLGRVHEESRVSDTTLLLLGAVSTAAVAGGWLMRNSRYLNSLRAR